MSSIYYSKLTKWISELVVTGGGANLYIHCIDILVLNIFLVFFLKKSADPSIILIEPVLDDSFL